MPLIQPLTIYAYLFLPDFGDILEYRIVFEEEQYLVRKGELDSEMKPYYEPDIWRSTARLSDAIKHVVLALRMLHQQTSGKPSMPETDLPQVYVPMIFAIQDAAEAQQLPSVVMIGEKTRYKNLLDINIFLGSFGFANATTVKPGQFLFGDFIRAEKQAHS
jgi:hypothetical protein